MFYEPTNSKILRLGDVVTGYLATKTKIKQPFLSIDNSIYHNYTVNFEVPNCSVVLTPCCSIGEQNMICISPLIPLKKDFFKNPYLVDDFTRINRQIEPDKAYALSDWQKLPPEVQHAKLASGKSYIEYYLFVYAPNDYFQPYELRGEKTQFYMVDFRNIQTIRCDLIRSREHTLEEETNILASKCVQLSIKTREELRMKLAHYFGRRPAEDEIE